MLWENMSFGTCRQQRPRSAFSSMQSDQGLHRPLTESLDTTECMNGEQLYFANVHDDLNLHILCMFEDAFSIWADQMQWVFKPMWMPRSACKLLGPVVQSVVSLTSSLRVNSLTILADSMYNILIFFAEKMWVTFALQKLLTFFHQKISENLRITWCKF